MRVKQFIIPLLLILILVMFNRVFMGVFFRANNYFSTEFYKNEEITSSQKLFDKAWKAINKDYYEPDMNNQNWERWKNRYQNKIKDDDDAKVAIDTMVASLNEPYTRFMPAKEFEESKG